MSLNPINSQQFNNSFKNSIQDGVKENTAIASALKIIQESTEALKMVQKISQKVFKEPSHQKVPSLPSSKKPEIKEKTASHRVQEYLNQLGAQYGIVSLDPLNDLLILQLLYAFADLSGHNDFSSTQQLLSQLCEVHMKYPNGRIPTSQKEEFVKTVTSICKQLRSIPSMQKKQEELVAVIEDLAIVEIQNITLESTPEGATQEDLIKFMKAYANLYQVLTTYTEITVNKHLNVLQGCETKLLTHLSRDNLTKILQSIPSDQLEEKIKEILTDTHPIQSSIKAMIEHYRSLLNSLTTLHQLPVNEELMKQLLEKQDDLEQQKINNAHFCILAESFIKHLDPLRGLFCYDMVYAPFKELKGEILSFLRKGYPSPLNQQILELNKEVKNNNLEQSHHCFIRKPLQLLSYFLTEYDQRQHELKNIEPLFDNFLILSKEICGESPSHYLDYLTLLLMKSSSFLKELKDAYNNNKLINPIPLWIDDLFESLSSSISSFLFDDGDNETYDKLKKFASTWKQYLEKFIKTEKDSHIKSKVDKILLEHRVFNDTLMLVAKETSSNLNSILKKNLGQEEEISPKEKTVFNEMIQAFLDNYSSIYQKKQQLKSSVEKFIKLSAFKKGGEYEEYGAFLKVIGPFIDKLKPIPSGNSSLNKKFIYIFESLHFSNEFLKVIRIQEDLALIKKNPLKLFSAILNKVKMFHDEYIVREDNNESLLNQEVLKWVPLFNELIQSFSDYPFLPYLVSLVKNNSLGVEEEVLETPVIVSNNNNSPPQRVQTVNDLKEASSSLLVPARRERQIKENDSSSEEELVISEPSPLALVARKEKKAKKKPPTKEELVNNAFNLTSQWKRTYSHLKKIEGESFFSRQIRETIFVNGLANIQGYLAEISEEMEQSFQERLDRASTHCRALSDNAFLYLEQALKTVIAYFDIPSPEDPQQHILLGAKEVGADQRPLRYDHNIHNLFKILSESLNIHMLDEPRLNWLEAHKDVIQRDLRYPADENSLFSTTLYQINQLTQLKQWMKKQQFPPVDKSVAQQFHIDVEQEDIHQVIQDIKEAINPLFQQIETECFRAISIANYLFKSMLK